MRFAAVIFDLDGTLLDTERLIVSTGDAVLAAMGYPGGRAILERMVGTVGDDIADVLRANYGPHIDPARFEREWAAAFEGALLRGIPLRPGVSALLDHLDELAMPRAVATNSNTHQARTNLDRAGILPRFHVDNIHGRDRVTNPKPAPDLFLHAAAGLCVDPAACLVFEDSDTGATAAVAAGMTVVHVPDQRQPGATPAQFIAPDLIAGAVAVGLITQKEEMRWTI